MTELPPDPATTRPRSGNYDLIVVLFCGMLLISNIGATKLIQFGPIITDGGAFLFPLTYIFGDVLSEVYGFRRARRAIFMGFGLSILASLTFYIVQIAPAADAYENQAAFEAVLGFVPADRAGQPVRVPGRAAAQRVRAGEDQGTDQGEASCGPG